MDQNDLSVARDVGELRADMRTVKHDLSGVQQSLTLINDKLNSIAVDRSKGLGFFAGASFIIATFGGLLIAAIKILFVSKGAS